MDKKQPAPTPKSGPKTPVRGLKVRTVNLLMILCSCLLYIVLLLATFRAAGDYRDMVSATDLYILCQQEAAMVSDGSDYLTEQVRSFTVTPDLVYAENYFAEANTTRRRDQALEQLNGQASPQAQGYLELALDYSNQLMGREIYAMRLAAEAQAMDIDALPEEVQAIQLSEIHQELAPRAKAEQARELVFGQEYQAKKQLISSNIDFFLTDVMGSTQRGAAAKRGQPGALYAAGAHPVQRPVPDERVHFRHDCLPDYQAPAGVYQVHPGRKNDGNHRGL